MSEKSPSLESESVLTAQEQHYLEQENLFARDYHSITVEQLNLEQCAEKVAELEALFTNFEQTHDLDALRAVQLRTVEEAFAHTVREAAKKDLPALVSRMNFLKKQEHIPVETFHKLATTYNTIQAAVGTLRDGGYLDHSIRRGF